MMNTVYKYTLRVLEDQIIRVPEGSKWLHIGVQNGEIKLWAQCPDNSDTVVPRDIKIVGTGWAWDDDGFDYIGSVQLEGFVWHVYGN